MQLPKNTTLIRSELLSWYQSNRRDLPWRDNNVSPYVVLVSEFMLQQTQAHRVANLLPPFISKFPTVEALSKASTSDVIKAWRGLGYNNRAIRLQKTARSIVDEHNGIVPNSEGTLLSLPGIGKYTAAAIATFAYGAATVVLDVNVKRVYYRILGDRATGRQGDKAIEEFARAVMPEVNTAEWYHAVMDLGATICMARVAKCEVCPLAKECSSVGMKNTELGIGNGKSKGEPSFKRRPNRLWRGEIVNVLRGNSEWISVTKLAAQIGVEHQNARTMKWLNGILDSLTTDGLIVQKKNAVKLPD